MSLYHEAAQVLDTAREKGGSIKSIVFGKTDWKSDRKAIFALSTETAKWSAILSEIIERSEVLKVEKQLSPLLALLLTHDLLLSKKGVALPQKHGLHVAISRHKARLSAELTKARIKRSATSLEALRSQVDSQDGAGDVSNDAGSIYRHPRWVRVNTLRSSLEEQLRTTFAHYKQTPKLADIMQSSASECLVYIDEHVPNLLAISQKFGSTKLRAYRDGSLILQDKASCFPACLLDPSSEKGDLIDACAAPGNKTTHLAALVLSPQGSGDPKTQGRRIWACEKNAARSQTLRDMIKLAGADNVVRVNAKQDFLKLNPLAKDYANVTALLLDPSCSGSGIVGRDEVSVKVCLPSSSNNEVLATRGKKRKRTTVEKPVVVSDSPPDAEENDEGALKASDGATLRDRLEALSAFQLRLLQHAMTFPAARRITYSTCSLHDEENEHVVLRALTSDVAKTRGWQILERTDQVPGMRKWQHRGRPEAMLNLSKAEGFTNIDFNIEATAEACIRCEKGTSDGTMGFFVAGFVRDTALEVRLMINKGEPANTHNVDNGNDDDNSEEEWGGFDSDEG